MNETNSDHNENGSVDISRRDQETTNSDRSNPLRTLWCDHRHRSRINKSIYSFTERFIQPARQQGTNVFGFLGAGERVGNSAVAVFTALFLSKTKIESVVLVDANSNRPILKDWFEIDAPTGISDAINDFNELEIATRPTSFKNLNLVHIGTNPSKIDESPNEFGGIISALSDQFSYVIVDLPHFEQHHMKSYSNIESPILVGGAEIKHNQSTLRNSTQSFHQSHFPLAGVFINEIPD